MSATDDSGEVKVGPPGVKMGVMIKFAVASMAMVATPTSIFFLSHYGYLDCALSTSSATAIALLAAQCNVKLVVLLCRVLGFDSWRSRRESESSCLGDSCSGCSERGTPLALSLHPYCSSFWNHAIQYMVSHALSFSLSAGGRDFRHDGVQ